MAALAVAVAAAVGIVIWLISRNRKSVRGSSEDDVGGRENVFSTVDEDSECKPERAEELASEGQVPVIEAPTILGGQVRSGTKVEALTGSIADAGFSEEPREVITEHLSERLSSTPALDDLRSTWISEIERSLTELEPARGVGQTETKTEASNSTGGIGVGAATQLAREDLVSTKVGEKKERVDPEKRGGRPRDVKAGHDRDSTEVTHQRIRKPEIVCWQREREWNVAVEMPEPLAPEDGLRVFENDHPLLKDEYQSHCFCLHQLHGKVTVNSEDENYLIDLNDDYLLFKLTGGNDGRRVKRPSSGCYLAVVPSTWQRDEELSGTPPVAPEPLSVDGFKAHFFTLTTDHEVIAFKDESGELISISSSKSHFELVGNRLNDSSEHIGPLFAGSPPQIRVLDSNVWGNVRTIVVGEEGSRQDGWRRTFNPKPNVLDQAMPSEVQARKGGWYFLRLYDLNEDLLESLDFRFISGLNEIKVTQPSPLPSEAGHQEATIEFSHEPECKVTPEGKGLDRLTLHRTAQGTSVTIPPDPAFDHTHWKISRPPSVELEIGVLVERVWWFLTEEGSAVTNWFDIPLSVERSDFAATSSLNVEIHFPKARWAEEVHVGFDASSKHRYRVKVDEARVSFPLRDFGGAAELTDRSQGANLKVWVPRKDMPAEVITVCELRTQDTRPPIAEPLIPKAIDPHPCNRRSCLTCDHAKVRRQKVKCRLGMWDDNRAELLNVFEDEQGHGGYVCGRWCGEYRDLSGEYHST